MGACYFVPVYYRSCFKSESEEDDNNNDDNSNDDDDDGQIHCQLGLLGCTIEGSGSGEGGVHLATTNKRYECVNVCMNVYMIIVRTAAPQFCCCCCCY